jgi:Tol biopolymer transport system component
MTRFLALVVSFGSLSLAQVTTRESVRADGSQLNADSGYSCDCRTRRGTSISADGRFVAYTTLAAADPGDTNGASDVYVRDRETGAVIWAGGPMGGSAWRPSLSADGRWVAFLSGNFFGGYVLARDLQASQPVTLVSGADARWLQLSGTGRYVALATTGPLVPGDTRYCNDDPNDPNSFGPCQDVYVLDRDGDDDGVFDDSARVFTRASVASDGTQANDQSFMPAVSDDGRFTVFTSVATNLVADDTNGVLDVFLHDGQTGITRRLSVTSDGQQVPHGGNSPSISADGRFVAFGALEPLIPSDLSQDSDVYRLDLWTNELVEVTNGPPNGPGLTDDGINPVLSRDGAHVVYASGGVPWVRPVGGQRTLVFTGYRGVVPWGLAQEWTVSDDGRFVAFASNAVDFVVNDTNVAWDVFVRDTFDCAGTVQDGSGAPVDVLTVNGVSGIAEFSTNLPIVLGLDAPPQGPARGAYLVWAWSGLPSQQTALDVHGTTVGCTMNPTSFAPGVSPRPIRCIAPRTFGPACDGTHRITYSAATTPWRLRRNLGFSHPVTLTFQGALVDQGAANAAHVSVTNVVYLLVR